MKPSIGIPNAYIYIYGNVTTKFLNTGNVFKTNSPYLRMKGMMSDTKKMLIEGSGFVWSPNLNYFAAITFSPGGGGIKRMFGGGSKKDRDEIEGTAFSVHNDTIMKFESSAEPRADPKLKHGKALAAELFKIQGKWSSEAKIGNM